MNFSGNFAYWLGTIAACFTTLYYYRLVYLAYLNRTNAVKSFVLHAHEPQAPMSIPLIVLAIGSLFIGYMTKDMIIGLGSGFWGNSIFILSKNVSFLEAEYLPYHVKLIPFIFTHIGLFVAYHTSFVLSGHTSSISSTTHRSILSFQKHIVSYNFFMSYPINMKIYSYFNQKWHFDDLYNRFIVHKALTFGYNTSFRLLDNGWVAFIGPYGIASVVQYFSAKLGKLQSGYVYHYAFIILTSMTLFIGGIVFLSSSSEFSDFILSQSSESTHGLYFILIIVFWHLTTKKSL
jgi:NADH-ubiquinone oxidoreductase chain 5